MSKYEVSEKSKKLLEQVELTIKNNIKDKKREIIHETFDLMLNMLVQKKHEIITEIEKSEVFKDL